MKNKRLAINMIANIISFIVTMGVNFLLGPYIIKTVGEEAYGFVGLANNFVGYAQIITIALNSMASRFITIKIHQNDYEKANSYFTSVVFSNTIMAIVMLIPSLFFILFMDKIISVPNNIVLDVKLLWAFIFINFLLSIISSTFSIATFVKNRLDLSSIRSIQANIIKVIILIFSFSFFKASVWYLGFASLICTIFISIYDIYYKKKLLPDLIIDRKYFDYKAIKELMASGIWNMITKLGQVLTDGLDLLITNLFIDASSMGILAIAKTVPSAVANLLMTITGVFSPQLTISYAKNNKDQLIKDIKTSMKIGGLFTNIALGFTIIFGYMFYSLWVPGQNIKLIQEASILTIYGLIAEGAVNTLFGVFTITNRLKLNSIIVLGNGILNTILVFIFIKTTNLGILAVAGISTTTALIRNLTFVPIYAAICLKISKKTFYPTIFKCLTSSMITIGVFYIISLTTRKYSWGIFFAFGILCSIIGVIINYIFIFDKSEKLYVFNLLNNRYLKIRRKIWKG